MKAIKRLTLILSIFLFTSCGVNWHVSTHNHDPIYDDENYIKLADDVIVDTLSEFQFRNKLRTDIGFRLDFARYALSQPVSFDWNNRLLGRQYDSRYNSYYWNRDQMWNDWAWGYTGWNSWGSPHRWSPFGYDRWGYNMNYGWNNHGWNYGWNNGFYNQGWPYWNNNVYGSPYWRSNRQNTSYINGRRGSLRTTTRNSRAHSSMIESTKRTTKPRRVIRTNTTPINNNITKPRRVIREKPVVPVIRNNNTRPVIRNNSRNNNIRPTSTRPIRNNTTRTNNNRTTSTNKRTTKKN